MPGGVHVLRRANVASIRALARSLDQRLRPEAWKGLPYWERRARTMGARAVVNAGATDEQLAEIRESQRSTMFPILSELLSGNERLALDFGCGPGRFTAELADAIGGRAVGVDPVAGLLELAPAHPRVEYRRQSGGRIPLGDAEADVAWICLVLGGITDSASLRRTVVEIERVLKPGGLMLLAECTNLKPDLPYWSYRPVDEYAAMFESVDLTARGQYMELDNTVTVLAGRRAPG
jgi:SAM-dependent methyltransferase